MRASDVSLAPPPPHSRHTSLPVPEQGLWYVMTGGVWDGGNKVGPLSHFKVGDVVGCGVMVASAKAPPLVYFTVNGVVTGAFCYTGGATGGHLVPSFACQVRSPSKAFAFIPL